MAILLYDSNVSVNLETISPQAARVLSSAKYCSGYDCDSQSKRSQIESYG